MKKDRFWQPLRSIGVATMVFLCSSLALPTALAAEALDQRQEAVNAQVTVPGGMKQAQTFTAGLSGRLSQVSVHVANLISAVELTVELQGVTATGEPSGVALASQRLAFESPSAARWVDVRFDSPPAVAAGTVYAIVMTPSSNLSWSSATTGPYPGGRAFSGADTWWAERGDYTFRTYVISGNGAPQAAADGYEVDEESRLTLPAPGLLANDADPDGDPLTAVLTQYPRHGILALTSDGSFTYLPDRDFDGPDSFTYKASDGQLESDPVTVSLTVRPVNDAPVLGAFRVPAAVRWGEAVRFAATAADPDREDRLRYRLVNGPAGAAMDESTGQFDWVPEAGQLGDHRFTVEVSDGALTDEAEATIQVGPRPSALVYTGELSGQYSDRARLAAVLTDGESGAPLAGQPVLLQVGEEWISLVTDTEGQALHELDLTGPEGFRTLSFAFAGGAGYQSSRASGRLGMQRERVVPEYTGDTFVLAGAGSATVELRATLTPEEDGLPGDLTLAQVRFELYRIGSGAPEVVLESVPVDLYGQAVAAVSLPVGNWNVKVSVPESNPYWFANPVDQAALTVDPGTSSGRVTGGGWLEDGPDKGHFAFTVGVHRNGSVKGHALYHFTGADGYQYVVRSTTWAGGGLGIDQATGRASFRSRSALQKVDPATGKVVGSESGMLLVTLEDGETDRIAITVLGGAGEVRHQAGGPVTGGQVVVHAP